MRIGSLETGVGQATHVVGEQANCGSMVDSALHAQRSEDRLDFADRPFRIACLQNASQLDLAAELIERRYAWRGYAMEANKLFSNNVNEITFVAYEEEVVVGTLTLGLDSRNGLLADDLYRDEIDWYRRQGRRCFELTRLALSPSPHSKEVYASLFHLAFIFGRLIHRMSDVFIEVNPRHLNFYQRMLGLEQIGAERTCARVEAPAVLLHGDMDYIEEQIREHGGSAYKKGRSLYPYFFSQEMVDRIVSRLGINSRAN